MSGNRMKLKNGLFSILLLCTSYICALDESHVNELREFTKEVNAYADRTFNKKTNPKTYVNELSVIIARGAALENSIPLVPTTSEKLKVMVGDLRKSLEAMRQTLSTSTDIASLRSQLGSSSLLKELLEKAQQDLDALIEHANKHPEDCSAEVLKALKEYKNSTFKECFDEWHPKTNSYFLTALNYIFKKR
jgi:uncharacterized coiled-coil DUF342 family protein